ncbi:MAG TPA: hypothetical protein VG820_08320 [Fimbriimonadaceae bacterium]|nr:hypothetical protein [Fimbriimonadaceae bacterium]
MIVALDVAIYAIFLGGCGGGGGGGNPPASSGSMVVFGYNDLGMHCMNEDFSELCILPPANTLRSQVINRSGEDPQIVTSGIQVSYSIPGNTVSTTKTNFWQYASALFGANLAPNVGLFGFGLSGNMQVTTDRDFWAHGVPVTPKTDAGVIDPYQFAQITVRRNGGKMAATQAVVPVSWEIRCDNCHTTAGISVATDILRKHDALHGTTLESHKPVLCAGCHADAALGTAGQSGVKPMSTAMHSAHADRMGNLTGSNICYSCHPGPQTECLRDVHKANNLTCLSCHTSMSAVGDTGRRPWVDEPRCGSCHSVAGHEYEQAGVLYRDSVGHNGVKCISCHGSPHAIGPSTNPRDNVQAIALQGVAGPISKCTVCHRSRPDDAFNHTRGGE